jgi:hypothetical protein
MNCSSSEEHFEALIEGMLHESVRASVLAHVDRCTTCSSVLEELRVIDALLLAPCEADLAPNFTFKVMAEVAAQPLPRPRRSPVAAFVVAYSVAAWMLIGVFIFMAGPRAHAAMMAVQNVLATVFSAFSGFSHVAERGFSHGLGTLTALVGGVLVLDLILASGVAVAYLVIRPRLAARIATPGARS